MNLFPNTHKRCNAKAKTPFSIPERMHSMLLALFLCCLFIPSNAQVYLRRDIPPATPAAVPTFTLRGVKMVQYNSVLYSLFNRGNTSNANTGRFVIKVSDLNGGPTASGSWEYSQAIPTTITDLMVDQVSGKLILIGTNSFIGVVDPTTGDLSTTRLTPNNIEFVSMTQFNSVNNSDLVVLGCTGLSNNPTLNMYVLNRTNILSNSPTSTIRAQVTLSAGNYTRGYGVAITEQSNRIILGFATFTSGPWTPVFSAYEFNNSTNVLTMKDLVTGANNARLYTNTATNPNKDATIDDMEVVPGTENVVFSVQSNTSESCIGVINYNDATPTSTSITIRPSPANASYFRRGLKIAMAPNGSEVTMGGQAEAGGGPLTPYYRIALSTTSGITSFGTPEELVLPSVAVPSNPNSNMLVAYDATSKLYGYINSYDYAGLNTTNERFYQFRAPAIGVSSECFELLDFANGNTFNASSVTLTEGAITHTLGSFTYPIAPTEVEFKRRCEGCNAEPTEDGVFEDVNLSFCDVPGDADGAWFNFCNYLASLPGYTFPSDYMYTLDDLNVPPRFTQYNSDEWIAGHPGSDGCISHHLMTGSFEFHIRDNSNCTFKTLRVNVTTTTPTLNPTGIVHNISFCQTPGTNGAWFNPCTFMSTNYSLPADFMYTLDDQNIPPRFTQYNSDEGSGCISHHLMTGTFYFDFYDKTNCTINRLIVTVTPNTPAMDPTPIVYNISFCQTPGTNGMWFNPCTYMSSILALPTSFMYTLDDQNIPPRFTQYNSDEGSGCISHHLMTGTFHFDFYDKANCTIKRLIVNVSANTPTLNPIVIVDNLSFCKIPGTDGLWFNPCTYMSTNYSLPASFMYTLDDQNIPPRFTQYNSDEGSGCISHHLMEGVFFFDFYDKNSCTIQRLQITVTGDDLKTIVCPTVPVISYNCDWPQSSLDNIDVDGDCPTCTSGPGKIVSPWTVTGMYTSQGYYMIQREIIDPANCTRCIINARIESVQATVIDLDITTPPCSLVNISYLMPCNIQAGPGGAGQIEEVFTDGERIPVEHSVDFCCPANPSTRIFETIINGCICRLTVNIHCPITGLRIPGQANTMKAGISGTRATGSTARTTTTGINGPGTATTSVSVYPNPSSGIFNVSLATPQVETYDVVVYDLTGKVVYSRTGLDANSVSLIDLSVFANGMYTAKVIVGDQTKYFKLIKN